MNRFITSFGLAVLLLASGCDVGEQFRNVDDYQSIQGRLPSRAVSHFPNTAPKDAKMYGYFMPMQGGSGLHLEIPFEQSEFEQLLTETKEEEYKQSIGVDFDDPDTLLVGETSPQIYTGTEPEIPKPTDIIFTIEDMANSEFHRGITFRTSKQTVVYWTFVD